MSFSRYAACVSNCNRTKCSNRVISALTMSGAWNPRPALHRQLHTDTDTQWQVCGIKVEGNARGGGKQNGRAATANSCSRVACIPCSLPTPGVPISRIAETCASKVEMSGLCAKAAWRSMTRVRLTSSRPCCPPRASTSRPTTSTAYSNKE